ncbi:hypothetical protein DRW41_15815 [Neobacillus piezotolerans]|uniref:Uncharacterized protein n=1 Tax=Neobacillus piezotolerans TaxID=2259171 RepID=A0A3D8GNK2_9BACI|nr:hypothetical protein [Neobacillus piezotolerans]RDU36053.1 hypothetical protein DRW41_15815 [Neobacillus piezotolerans]
MSTEKIIESLVKFAERLDRLENALNDSQKSKIHFDIHINDLHLNELNLEELAFHLERLDIQELSGMLNLGNTFSPKVHGKEKLNEPVPEDSPESSSEEKDDRDIQIMINGEQVSYLLMDGKDNHDE